MSCSRGHRTSRAGEFSSQFIFSSHVARREVKRHGGFDPRGSSDYACSACREMRFALRVFPVSLEKDGLDEQQIGPLRELRESISVALIVGHIRDITDSLAGHELQDLLPELAKCKDTFLRTIAHAPVDSNRRVVRCACTHLPLQFGEPRAGREPQLLQTALPHVDVHVLLEGKCERSDVVMLERYGAYPEQWILEQHT